MTNKQKHQAYQLRNGLTATYNRLTGPEYILDLSDTIALFTHLKDKVALTRDVFRKDQLFCSWFAARVLLLDTRPRSIRHIVGLSDKLYADTQMLISKYQLVRDGSEGEKTPTDIKNLRDSVFQGYFCLIDELLVLELG